MMLPIRLGTNIDTNERFFLDPESFRTHYHLLGATGAGKTTAIHAMLRPLMAEPKKKACIFVLDRMGNLSRELLQWMASRPRLQHVRNRLLYIEPAREEFVLPFNPLHFHSEANFYYQVARAVDLILRAWKSHDVTMQPRLLQWSYKALCAMCALGYPISMSRFLLHPGTDEHKALLRRMPPDIQHHWAEILNAKGSEPTRILESTRNRFDPFYESVILRRMFGISESRFDVERLIRERRIVIVNLAKLGKLPMHLGGAIGALIANEVFETAFNMATLYGKQTVDPTYVLMDEFQSFIGPDIEEALPTVRQMGLRLILANQSFSQLQQEDIDLSSMIWQARSRLMFANSAEDADIIAQELATLTFDPMKVKHEMYSIRQRIAGYRREWLESQGSTSTSADSYIDQRNVGYSRNTGDATRFTTAGSPGDYTLTNSSGNTTSNGHTTGGTHANSHSNSSSRSETMMPIHEEVEDLSSVTFESFAEHMLKWQKDIRQLPTGNCFASIVNDPNLYRILVDYSPVANTSRIDRAVDELIQKNFEDEFFISAAEADRQANEQRRKLLTDRIVLPSSAQPLTLKSDEVQPTSSRSSSPFRNRSRAD